MGSDAVTRKYSSNRLIECFVMAYTYLIGWSRQNKWYYGVRYRVDAVPSDLWVTYFTSSKAVSHFRIKYGDPDIIQIRKVFEAREQAIAWEHKVLKRMKVANNPRFLNMTANYAVHKHINGEKLSKLLSNTLKGKRKSQATKQILSVAAKKRWSKIDRTGSNNVLFQGYYITPWGKFVTSQEAINDMPFKVDFITLISWCKNNTRKIHMRSKIFNENIRGKTYEDLGFAFEKVG